MPAVGDLLLGRYRILDMLGAGGMATVYRAHDVRLERDVAIKVLLSSLVGDAVLAARFEREARTLAAAAHPGVVGVYDVDPGDPSSGREPFFVMELCVGGTLADRMAGGRPLAPDDLVPVLASVAEGLADLHARGIVHRDVKPSNILLAPDRAKLADFGIARDDAAESSDLTTPGTALGTMAYLAPEILAGEGAAGAADVYALGVAAFAGLTGSLPRPAGSLADVAATSRDPAPRVSEFAADLGPAFDEPIAAALATDPVERPDALAFATSMAVALGRSRRTRPSGAAATNPASRPESASDATTIAVPTASPGPADRPPNRRDRLPRRAVRLTALTVLVVFAALALGAFAGTLIGTGSPAGTGSAPASAPAGEHASPSSTARSSQGASPSASPSGAGRALAALDAVDLAIADTTGRDGLKGKERNELAQVAGSVRAALVEGDIGTARSLAKTLATMVDDVDGELDEGRARRLSDAIAALVEVIGGA